jgi:CubicO group peptidase (beta-lactamase class C family)
VASVTKVAATMQAVMKLYDEGQIELEKPLSYYFPETSNTLKGEMTLKDVLMHQAGLYPFLEHWRKTVDSKTGKLSEAFYCVDRKDSAYANLVCKGIYAKTNLEDSIWKWTLESELIEKENGVYPYAYSDLGYIFLKRLIEKKSGISMDEYVYQNFYNPLGLQRLTYLPLEKFPADQLAPTEKDELFRNRLVRGTVHDQAAAMMGGVAGHAGVFSNAASLAKILQMNLEGGTYNGKRFISDSTINIFTRRHDDQNRRGLGWDKPDMTGRGPTSEYCSPQAYGHSGFTGTCVWVDPEYDLIYIFLSNRVYPDASNNLLVTRDVRTRIHDIIYRSIVDFKETQF